MRNAKETRAGNKGVEGMGAWKYALGAVGAVFAFRAVVVLYLAATDYDGMSAVLTCALTNFPFGLLRSFRMLIMIPFRCTSETPYDYGDCRLEGGGGGARLKQAAAAPAPPRRLTRRHVALIAPRGTPSDARLKEDVREVFRTKEGIPVYIFRYKQGKGPSGVWQGVLAQDLLTLGHDSAVSKGEDGYYRVDYETLGVSFTRVAE